MFIERIASYMSSKIFRLAIICVLLIASTTSISHAQRIYDGSGRFICRVDGNKYYDGSGRNMGKVENDRIYDSSGRNIGSIDLV